MGTNVTGTTKPGPSTTFTRRAVDHLVHGYRLQVAAARSTPRNHSGPPSALLVTSREHYRAAIADARHAVIAMRAQGHEEAARLIANDMRVLAKVIEVQPQGLSKFDMYQLGYDLKMALLSVPVAD